MSRSNARSDIESEFEDAKETAFAYLRAVLVLPPDAVSPREYREREERALRNTILSKGKKAVELPNDPGTRDAAVLGYQYLYQGHDPGILEALREREPCHPAYGEALGLIALGMQKGGDMPVWEPGSESERRKRWSRARPRGYRTGMGSDTDSDKTYREKARRRIRNAILMGGTKAVDLPDDPSACDAAILGHRYLHQGRDPGTLEVLEEKNCRHPAYGEALRIIAHEIRKTSAEMPDWLGVWEPGSESERKKRWARTHPRSNRSGMSLDGLSSREYREREERAIRDTILSGGRGAIELPNDPFARHAAILGLRYLHQGCDTGILRTLQEGDRCHPAYGEALKVIVLELREMGAGMPDWLRVWIPMNEKRWSRTRAQNYRIGLVIGAMAAGTNTLFRYGENETEREQLQWDLQAVRAAAGRRFKDLSNEDVLESVNEMRVRRRGHPDQRRRLTERDLVKLTKGPAPGIEAIVVKPEVRKQFPNLFATSGEATKNGDSVYSICDAVAEVLQAELPRQGRSDRNKPWDRTVARAWKEYREARFLREK